MKVLLDTHAWIWWQDISDKLSFKAREAIEKSHSIGISTMSCWEIAMLIEKKRLKLDRDVLEWIQQSLTKPRVQLIPLSPEIAVAATRLVNFHDDPSDRIIVASALEWNATLITKDQKILAYPEVQAIW